VKYIKYQREKKQCSIMLKKKYQFVLSDHQATGVQSMITIITFSGNRKSKIWKITL